MDLPSTAALVVVEPGRLRVEQRRLPAAGPTDALVRPRRVGVCGTDYHIFEGTHPFLEYPRVIGHELAVEVVEAPPGSGLAPGTICVANPYVSCGRCVACRAGKPNCCVRIEVLGVHRDGGMAERLVLPAANLIPADGLSLDQCAAVEFLAIGAHAVRRGAVGRDDRVLVVGAGPIGLGVALFARLAGGKVAVLDRDPDRVAAAEAVAGVDGMRPGPDLAAALAAYTDGEDFDVVFDATGTQAAMQKGFDFVAHAGRYVLVSVVREAITFMDPDFHRKEMTLLASRNATAEDFAVVIKAIRNHKADVSRMITHRTSLAGAVSDIPIWASRKTGLIKALVDLD